MKNLPKIPPGNANAASLNQFSGKYVDLLVGSSHRESTANRSFTIGNAACIELREPEKMDLPRISLGQSDHKDDSARKPT